MYSQVQRGISLIILPLPSERVGERLLFTSLSLRRGTGRGCFGCVSGFCRASVQASEIPLQIIRHYCSQINSLSLKIAFVTSAVSIGYKQACKRCPFALQNMPFYTSKDALLHCKRASFRTQKGVDGKEGRKDVDKNNPPKYGLPKPLRRRGCAWRDTECWELGI